MSLLTLTIGTHFFKVTKLTPRARAVVMDFVGRFVKYKLVKEDGRFKRKPDAIFACRTNDFFEYRFHINALKDFLDMLNLSYIKPELYTTVQLPVPLGLDVELPMQSKWTVRDYQEPIINFLTNPIPPGPRSRMVGIQTGQGKTFCATKASSEIGKRVVVIVRAMFMSKWVKDFLSITELTKDDIITVNGGAQLQTLLAFAKEGKLEQKIIIVSITTLQIWFKEYEEHGAATLDLGYECLPEDFFATVGAGLRLIDEVHLDLHMQLKIDTYTNIERSISLSATMLNNDPFIEKMQKLLYPLDNRYNGLALKKYIRAYACLYYIKQHRRYNTKEYGSNNYSHNAFEKSILKDITFRDAYFELIKGIAEEHYMKRKKPGQKLLVFCASVNLCTKLTDFFKKCYPHLDVRRFVQDDPDENMLEPDIRVTTVLSGGTAHDVNGLITSILTTSIASIQSNIQALGRLREAEGEEMRFIYLSSLDIPKHMSFHEQKVKMLNERAASVNMYIHDKPL